MQKSAFKINLQSFDSAFSGLLMIGTRLTHTKMFIGLLLCLSWMNIEANVLVATKEIRPDTYTDLTYSTCFSKQFDYIDTIDGTCKKCDPGMVRDLSVLDPMGDAIQCKCAPGYAAVENSCFGTTDGTCKRLTCTQCTGATPAAYADRSACTSCDLSTSTMDFSPAALECICSTPGHVLVETDNAGIKLAQKTCKACPTGQQAIVSDKIIAGSFYAADSTKCRSCPSPHMSMSALFVCTCDAGYEMTGHVQVGSQSCIASNIAAEFKNVETKSVVVHYDSQLSVASLTLTHYFVKAAAECKYYGGPQDSRACQILANLCVLQLYDTSAGACAAFQSIQADRGTVFINSIMGWNAAMPWLYYKDSTACQDKSYRQTASLKSQLLRYVVGAYTLNGTFAGYQSLNSFFAYCSRNAPYGRQGTGASTSNSWQLFGVTESGSYKCDLDALLNKQQLFYEMYLYDPSSESDSTAYMPVPVRVVNMTVDGYKTYENNATHPVNLCNDGDLLVRRFMLVDLVSGLTTSSANVPAVIRYASDVTVEVSLLDNYQISSPVLSIYYGISQPGSWPPVSQSINADGTLVTDLTSRTADVYFSGRYSQPMDSFQSTFNGWAIAVLVFCSLHAIYRYNLYLTRHDRLTAAGQVQVTQGLTLATLWDMATFAASSWVNFFFIVQTLVCWYFFAFFKLQGVPSILLPPQDDIYSSSSAYYIFTTNIIVMFVLQVFYCCLLIYRQCNIDIFFLDWEPPSGPKNDTRVSVWRTIFIANEWTEMCTSRVIDVRLNLIMLAFILIGCGQEYVAVQRPDVTDLTPGPTNIVLRFANTTWWWLCLSACQWGWKFFIWERFFAETREHLFIDLCTIAKVSILVLDEPYHGYYLHCRSPHQHADGTMVELIEMLHKEEAGLTVDRSLEGGPADVQSFRIFMSSEWRTAFSKIYQNLSRPSSISEMLNLGRKSRQFNGRGRGASGAMSPRADGGAGSVADKTLKAFRELTIFLQEFVENNFAKPGLRRTIREPTFTELVLDTAPVLNAAEQPCVFYPDRYGAYTKVMFLGREPELLLCNICVYSAFDMWTQNTMAAILITYAFDWVFCFVRQTYGTAVTSSKTLIDDRFLS